jgi:hypothetical protein
MGLKLYLNKFLKVDNIEYYTFSELMALKKEYEQIMEETEGVDPDFPMFTFGGKKGKKIKGTNVSKIEIDSPIREDGDDSISLTK